MWTKECADAEVANRIVDAVPIDPTARVGDSVEPAAAASGQPAAMERNTTNDQTGTRNLARNPVVEGDDRASCQPDENQLQTVDVSLDQKTTTTATKQRAATQLATNNVESGVGDSKSVAGHQTEQTESILPIQAMKYSANTIAEVSYQYEHFSRKLWDRHKHVAKYFSVIQRGKKSETVEGTQVRMAAIPAEKGDLVLETCQH